MKLVGLLLICDHNTQYNYCAYCGSYVHVTRSTCVQLIMVAWNINVCAEWLVACIAQRVWSGCQIQVERVTKLITVL